MNGGDQWLGFLLAALACWRVTHLLVYEDGPAFIVSRFRAMVATTRVGRAVDCFLCASIWSGGFVALAIADGIVQWGIEATAISGVACILERLYERPLQVEFDQAASEMKEEDNGMLR